LGISIIMFITMTYTLFFNKKWLSKAINSNYSSEDTKDLFLAFSWIVGLIVLVSLFGFVIGLVIFFIGLIKNKTDSSWIKILTLTFSAIAFMLTLSHFMTLDFPSGLLQYLVKLPWPFN
jgi:putative tricarboxylic transport membrane protein